MKDMITAFLKVMGWPLAICLIVTLSFLVYLNERDAHNLEGVIRYASVVYNTKTGKIDTTNGYKISFWTPSLATYDLWQELKNKNGSLDPLTDWQLGKAGTREQAQLKVDQFANVLEHLISDGVIKG